MVPEKVVAFMLLVGDWRNATTSNDAKMYDFNNQPYWLNTTLENNVDHMRRYHHRLDLKWMDAPKLLPWQEEDCEKDNDKDKCISGMHRKNANWLKLETILEYLDSPAAPEYVLMVDAGGYVIIHTKPNHDNLQAMIDTLAESGKSVMFGDESWGDHNAALRINGGVMFAKNTPWVLERNLQAGTIIINTAKIMNNSVCATEGVLLASGMIWNRHPKIGLEEGELIHFMGAAKSQL
eukprot:gene21986-19108_t